MCGASKQVNSLEAVFLAERSRPSSSLLPNLTHKPKLLYSKPAEAPRYTPRTPLNIVINVCKRSATEKVGLQGDLVG